MAPAGPLLFLLAPAAALGPDWLSSDDLAAVQSSGVSAASALRIVVTDDLGGRFNRVCDAITPRFEPDRLWLGVFQPDPAQPDHWRVLDRFPLSDARNETCWFYPTHDGHYLSWQRDLNVSLGPGRVVAAPDDLPGSYSRGNIALLWSLLADDTELTCVGLTYAGHRIDWPLQERQWAPLARWSSFSVDGSRVVPLIVHSAREVVGSAAAQPLSPA
jgi:hypothetical protein